MKKHTISTEDIPLDKTERLGNKIFSYISNNPNCTIAELYKLHDDSANVRQCLRKLTEGRRIKTCYIINNL